MHKSPKQREKLHQRNRRILCSFRDHVPPNRDWGGSLPVVMGQAPVAAAPGMSTGQEILSWASSGGPGMQEKAAWVSLKDLEWETFWNAKDCVSPLLLLTACCWELQRPRREVKPVAAWFLDMLWLNCCSCNCLKKKKRKKSFFKKTRKKEVMRCIVWTRDQRGVWIVSACHLIASD